MPAMRATLSIIAGARFHQHLVRLDHVVGDAAVDEEAAAVVDDDRRLLDRADEVERRASARAPVLAP